MAKGYKKVGKNIFRNVKKGSPRKGKKFRIRDGKHVYKIGGRKVAIGGKGKKGRGRRLTPQQRRRREARDYDPLQPLAGRDFNQEVELAARQQFRPLRRGIEEEQRVHQQQLQNIPSYFDKYQQDLAAANQRMQAGAASTQQAIYGQAAGMATQDAAMQQQLAQQSQQSAAIRGTAPDPTVAATGQQAAASRQGATAELGALAGIQAQAQQGYMGTLAGASGMERIRALEQEAAVGRELMQALQDLRRERGEFKTAKRGELREGERQYALERKAFNLDVREQKAGEREDRFGRRQERKQDRRDARNDRAERNRKKLLNRSTRQDIKSKKEERKLNRQADLADDGRRNYSTDYGEWAQRTRPDKDGGSSGSSARSGVSSGEARENKQSFSKLVRFARAGKNPPGSPDPLLMQVAFDIAKKGGTTPERARKIKRQYGFSVKVAPRKTGKAISKGGKKAPKGGLF